MDLPELSVSTLAHDRDRTCAVVALAGRAGIADAARFRQLLELPEAHESGRIILDLSRLSSIDWWAALILLWVGPMSPAWERVPPRPGDQAQAGQAACSQTRTTQYL